MQTHTQCKHAKTLPSTTPCQLGNGSVLTGGAPWGPYRGYPDIELETPAIGRAFLGNEKRCRGPRAGATHSGRNRPANFCPLSCKQASTVAFWGGAPLQRPEWCHMAPQGFTCNPTVTTKPWIRCQPRGGRLQPVAYKDRARPPPRGANNPGVVRGTSKIAIFQPPHAGLKTVAPHGPKNGGPPWRARLRVPARVKQTLTKRVLASCQYIIPLAVYFLLLVYRKGAKMIANRRGHQKHCGSASNPPPPVRPSDPMSRMSRGKSAKCEPNDKKHTNCITKRPQASSKNTQISINTNKHQSTTAVAQKQTMLENKRINVSFGQWPPVINSPWGLGDSAQHPANG